MAIIKAISLFLVSLIPTSHAQQPETINFLDYFIPSQTNYIQVRCPKTENNQCDPSKWEENIFFVADPSQSQLTVVKHLPSRYEVYSWDEKYIYLKYDSSWGQNAYRCKGKGSTYGLISGKWAKINTSIGETTTDANNQIVVYDENCQVCENTPQYLTTVLEARYPNFDLGENLGKHDVIVLRVYFAPPEYKIYEKFYYAKGLGWVGWEGYEKNDQKPKYQQFAYKKIANASIDFEKKCFPKTLDWNSFLVWRQIYLKVQNQRQVTNLHPADFNQDGQINLEDFSVWKQQILNEKD